MDNEIFRKTYRQVNERFCLYEKSILTNQCNCSQANRFCIAEREGVHCGSDAAQKQCLELLELIRHHSRFALKAREAQSALPHNKAMRLQVGGLRGVLSALKPEQAPPKTIDDVYAVISRARKHFGGLQNLPFLDVIKQVTSYRGRPPRRGRRDKT